jgi:hypothetical protein
MALMIVAGFVGGIFVQYKAPGDYAPFQVPHKKKKKAAPMHQVVMDDDGDVEAAPQGAPLDGPPPSAAEEAAAEEAKKQAEEEEKRAAEEEKRLAEEQAKALAMQEAGPATLRRYAAISAIVDSTMEIIGPNGEKRYIYFAPRGVVAEFDGDKIEARLWTRDDDRLCRSLDDDKRECFSFVVNLDEKLRKKSAKTVQERVRDLTDGSAVGTVEGLGVANVKLLRGNFRKLPGYVPLLEGKPAPEWTRDRTDVARSFVGALLVSRRRDETHAATFFAPNGQLFEVTRPARQTVNLWIGSWRRQGDLVCRDLSPADGARPEDHAEECAHARLADNRVEFTEASPTRRSFLRVPWADEKKEPNSRDASTTASPATGDVKQAPSAARPAAKEIQSSFTDLR